MALPTLQVIHATYADKSATNVSDKVRALMAANGGNLIIDAKSDFNKLFGDPEPGKSKLFHLRYRYGQGGAEKSITHSEKHSDIYLPALEIKQGQVLTVNVIKCVGLRDRRTIGKQNPYAKLKCGSEDFKTKVHEHGACNPEWKQSFIFNLDGKDQFMHVTVMDKETISDDTIARFDIPLPTLAAAQGEVAYNLVHPNDFKKAAGSIVLKCDFKDPNYVAPAATAAAPAPVVQAAPQPVVVQAAPQPVMVMQQPQMVYQQPVVQQQPQMVYQQPMMMGAQPAVMMGGGMMMMQPQVVMQQPQVVVQQQHHHKPASNKQGGWRWCSVCQTVFYSGQWGNGVCPAGGAHNPNGSGAYFVHKDGNPGGNCQGGWRWCGKCMQLHYPGATNKCPATGHHHDHSGSGEYFVQYEGSGQGQTGWKWCNKCGVLAYSGMSGRCCATGMMHDHGGSGNYILYKE